MKKLSLYLIVGICLSTSYALAKQGPSMKTAKKKSFNGGEQLTFLLHYGVIKGGKATLNLSDTRFNDNPALHAKMYAKTTGITDKIFRIEDIYESYFDHKNTMPFKSVRNINEGGYKYYNEVLFDHNDTSLTSHKSGKHSVPQGTLDMVSAFYYLRTIDLDTIKKGDEILINTFFDDALFPFKIRYKGKERIKTKLGKVRCHRFDPIVEPGRIFKSEDDMSFWLTDDENMLPVLIKFDLIVGSVKCELISYKNIGTDIEWE